MSGIGSIGPGAMGIDRPGPATPDAYRGPKDRYLTLWALPMLAPPADVSTTLFVDLSPIDIILGTK